MAGVTVSATNIALKTSIHYLDKKLISDGASDIGVGSGVWTDGKWVTGDRVGASATTTFTVSSGGLLMTSGVGGFYTEVSQARYNMPVTRYDQEVLTKVTCSASLHEQYIAIVLRGSNNWDAPTQSYYPTTGYAMIAEPSGNQFEVVSIVAGAQTGLTGSPISHTFSAGLVFWMRFKVVGSRVCAKMWDANTAEPNAWQFDGTDTSVAGPGVMQLFDQAGSGGNSESAKFENFQLIDLDYYDKSLSGTVVPSVATMTAATDIVHDLGSSLMAPLTQFTRTQVTGQLWPRLRG